MCGGKGGSQHLCTDNFYSNGVLGSTVPLATGIALAERERGHGRHRRRSFIGDGTLGQGVVYESLNYRLALEAAAARRRREQPLRAVDAVRARRSPGTIAARASGLRDRDGRARHDRRARDPRCGRSGRSSTFAAPATPFFLVLDTYRFSAALEGRRLPRPGGDRGAAHARPARGRRRATSTTASAPRSRAPSRSGSRARSSDGARGAGRRRPARERRERCVQVLNAALHDVFERARRRLPPRRGPPRPVRRRVQGDAGPQHALARPRPHDAGQRGRAVRGRRRASRCAATGRSSRSCSATSSPSASTRS